MKQKYYVNKNCQNGSGFNHEVHREGCYLMPAPSNVLYDN